MSGFIHGIIPSVFNALYGIYITLLQFIFKLTNITGSFFIGEDSLFPVSIKPSNLYFFLEMVISTKYLSLIFSLCLFNSFISKYIIIGLSIIKIK